MRAALRAAERLQRMVDALLNLSQAASGPLVPALAEVDLTSLTADVASMFRSTAEHAGVGFAVQVSDTPVPAEVDPAMWATIVNNLLSNAVKYTVDGTITVAVRALPEHAVELTVTDTGVGIRAEEQARVFDRFHRAQAGDLNDGAGIGLGMVADLVAAHGGRVTVQSTLGVGSRFTVSVPVA